MQRIACALRIVALSLVPLLAVPAIAGEPPARNSSANAFANGTIMKVDQAVGKVGIAHGPLPNLGMPAMSMVFKVKDASWLEKMKKGDRIRFVAEKVDGAYTVVRYESAGR